MVNPSGSTPSRDKVRAHCARLREQSRGPVQLWARDVRSPASKAEAARQARLVALDPHEAETMAFVESVTDWGDGGR